MVAFPGLHLGFWENLSRRKLFDGVSPDFEHGL